MTAVIKRDDIHSFLSISQPRRRGRAASSVTPRATQPRAHTTDMLALSRLRSFVSLLSRTLRGAGEVDHKDDGEPSEFVEPELEAQFNEAAQAVSQLSGLPAGDRLALYALFKQATVGNAPPASPSSSMLDPAARYKWTAWSRVAGMGRAEAMERYIRIITMRS